ncbi:hypothetical protein LAV_00007 [Sphingobium phage Lacusarx]|uniref:Phage protein n=1 Tax=Sphingobium phage Lacusarx TaxID=1980139 RepID=A0A1W6DWK8_9CAUD|nr:hypothetical protein FDH44_gp007 [Sphingobium phage Lacusarx]ARK07407.1 hypothetical protein LAV_00007 [Sphingobium phage Lacusarx]
MPVINFDSIDAVPAGLKEFAKTEDGKVTVNVVPSVKLDEFRDKNISLSQQIEATGPILARIKEIAGDDLDAFSTDVQGLRDIAKRVQDGELKTNDQIEAAVADRIKAVKDGYEDNAKALRNELQVEKNKAVSLEQRLNQTRIDKDVTSVVILPESGVRPEALPDLLQRAYRLFKVEGDKLVPKNGEATIYGANGADPMTVNEWLVKLRDEAPHYFKGNAGGGANGGKDGKVGGYSQSEISKMTAAQKLALANSQTK